MKLNQSNGAWLSAKKNPECDGQIITFKNEGEWRQSTRFKYDDGNPVNQLVFQIEFNGESYQMTLIKASRVAMIEAFGDDTITWVEQKAKISLALNTQGGKSIMLTPIAPVGGVAPEDVASVDLNSDGGEEEIPF